MHLLKYVLNCEQYFYILVRINSNLISEVLL
jgi:hypothetical protein